PERFGAVVFDADERADGHAESAEDPDDLRAHPAVTACGASDENRHGDRHGCASVWEARARAIVRRALSKDNDNCSPVGRSARNPGREVFAPRTREPSLYH